MNKFLKRLKLKLQANASSVEMNLGGENHRYLGLVLTDAKHKKKIARLFSLFYCWVEKLYLFQQV